MRKSLCLVLAAALTLAANAAPAADHTPSPEAIRAHVTFLADDLLEGRLTGTRGFDLAAAYVASRFAEMGVKPGAAGGGYLQRVPLVSTRPASEGEVALVGKGGARTPLVFGEDYFPSADASQAERTVSAPMVFVGFGLVAPEAKRDDYKGLNVKGKIVVALAGAPASFQTEERAYYGSSRNKRRTAEARGAVGFIAVYTPTAERRSPFKNGLRTWKNWDMTWREASGAAHITAPKTPYLAAISLPGAAKLLAGAPASVEAIMAAAESPAANPPRFALPSSLSARLTSELRPIESANVVGLIEGSDPRLKNEYVAISAHLDHMGVGEPVNGDAIHNGALDNAAGIAVMLEAARGFTAEGARPKRSLLFLALTAEEQGLVGAEYFAFNPTTPKGAVAANVNLDMPVLTYDFTDVVAFGAPRSSLGPAVERAAGRVGVKLSPDPMPEEGNFTRSDHFRFVEQGIPSVMLMTGFAGAGEKEFRGFLAQRYHRPNDDLKQAIDWAAGAKYARLNYEIIREIADAPERPRWNPGDFFGAKFAGGK